MSQQQWKNKNEARGLLWKAPPAALQRKKREVLFGIIKTFQRRKEDGKRRRSCELFYLLLLSISIRMIRQGPYISRLYSCTTTTFFVSLFFRRSFYLLLLPFEREKWDKWSFTIMESRTVFLSSSARRASLENFVSICIIWSKRGLCPRQFRLMH